jgi:hypothetical protein
MAGTPPNLFFYRPVGGMEQGPVPIDELRRLIANKRITAITQIRENGCLIWKYAADFSSLAQFLTPKPQNTAGDPFSKPLAQLTARDLPNLIRPYLRTFTNWAFFLGYAPATLSILFQSAYLLITGRSIREMYALWGLRMPQIIPVWLFVLLGICLVAMCVGPLVAWFAYAKRSLSWVRFILTWGGTYAVPMATMAVLALICYEREMRWATGMMTPWLPPSP